MDPNFPKKISNSEHPDSFQYDPNTQHQNSELFMYNNPVSIPENTQTPFSIPENTQTPQKNSRASKWETKEDVVLMSGWVNVSEEPTRGKNQKKQTFWSRVKEYYDEIRAENQEGLGIRNENQMKSRYARINEAANKWVAAYREAYRQKKSGMSMKDVEKQAHSIFEEGGSKFNELYVYNEVMCKHPKWALDLERNTTRSRPVYEVDDEESGGSTKRKALMHFIDGVISCFGDEYLRKPNEMDLARLLYVGDQRGFPGMIGSIDCMHWEWKNCPSAWAGQYAGRSGKPTIILEAVASYDLWIWHAFFGTPGSLNDINVLHRSPVFDDVLAGRSPKVSYVVNGQEYDRAYYLTDGIYPPWAAFVKSITAPQMQKHKLFAQVQESCRKDVERAFGVLQARFAFIRRPCLVWDRHLTGRIMIACIIIHNMIVEDERDTYQTYYDPTEFINDMPTNGEQRSSTEDDGQSTDFSTERIANLSRYMTNREQLRNREAHNALKNDLVEHIRQKFGQNN